MLTELEWGWWSRAWFGSEEWGAALEMDSAMRCGWCLWDTLILDRSVGAGRKEYEDCCYGAM